MAKRKIALVEPAATDGPIALPTRLDAADLPFHEVVVKQIRAAHDALVAAQNGMIEARGAQQTWSIYLTNKYGLQQKDVVTAEGLITRVTPDA